MGASATGRIGTPVTGQGTRYVPTSGSLRSRKPSASRAGSLRNTIIAACVAVVVARLIFVWQPLRADEGGYLLIARTWRAGGEFLYGDYHVDRPPLLMLIFRVAALSEWDGMIRLLTIPFAVIAVVAAARAAFVVAGDRASRWSAVVAAAFVSSPALAADQADGELFALAFVMVSVALALEAWTRPAGAARVWLAFGAGAVGSAASLVKPNFLEGLVFAAVLVIAELVQRRGFTSRSRTLAAGVAVGAVLPNLLVVAWASAVGVVPAGVWTELAAFRGAAFNVIWRGDVDAPVVRGVTLLALAVVGGLVTLAWTWAGACRSRGWAFSPVAWALNACLVFGVAAVVAGGSYWPHYLLQLAPMLALAAGMVAASDGPAGERARRRCKAVAWAAVAAVTVTTVVYATVPKVWFHQRTGEWLAESGESADTAIVLYGSPSVLEAAEMATPYPYLWSLPMRTLDPDQARLRDTLAGPDAPVWVVQFNSLNSWGIDDDGRLHGVLDSRYDIAATVCGHPVWLRADLSRRMAPAPSC